MKKLLIPCIYTENTGHFLRTSDLAFSATVRLGVGAVFVDQDRPKTCFQPNILCRLCIQIFGTLRETWTRTGAARYRGVSVPSVWCGTALWLRVSYSRKLNTRGEKTWHLGPSEEKGRENRCGETLKIIKYREWEYRSSSRDSFYFWKYLKISEQKLFWEWPKAEQRFLGRERFLLPSLDTHDRDPHNHQRLLWYFQT